MGVKEWALGIGILILMSFVVIYGIKTFYPEPQLDYDKFWSATTSSECSAVGGEWTPYEAGAVEGEQGYCSTPQKKQEEYDIAMRNHWRNVFLICILIAVILMTVGALLFSLESVGAGIMGGGIITLIYGSASYWLDMENWLRFLVSAFGLVALIVLGYVLSKKRKES